ncbi:hypothetical protein ACPUET_11215 [Paraburkholderia graminis]|uniref:hypothetical protein n=1 Tax=Paraburkholderia graminis TaxID=60548 RepID=UPI003C95C355
MSTILAMTSSGGSWPNNDDSMIVHAPFRAAHRTAKRASMYDTLFLSLRQSEKPARLIAGFDPASIRFAAVLRGRTIKAEPPTLQIVCNSAAIACLFFEADDPAHTFTHRFRRHENFSVVEL